MREISLRYLPHIIISDFIPQKRDLLAKHELRLDEVESVEVMLNNEAEAHGVS